MRPCDCRSPGLVDRSTYQLTDNPAIFLSYRFAHRHVGEPKGDHRGNGGGGERCRVSDAIIAPVYDNDDVVFGAQVISH